MTATPTTPDTGLLDAGLAPLDTVADGHTDRVRARGYTHAALGGRTVVRLVPDTLAPAEDAALDFLEFAPQGASEPLALARPRGLGYPEWALVHDPERTAEALAQVKPMERAARMAASRPGAAVEEFTRIATGVPVTHLASYWEQAGRAFIAAGSAKTAAVMFGRAREAERVYSIPVHEAARREAFLEFAFAGALTVKALAGHAAELAERYDPARAYAEFRELSLRRTLGGLPPWTTLPKQLRGLAEDAGLDADAETAALLRELVEIPVTASAPEGFWRAVRAGLVALCRADAGAAHALLGLFPANAGHGWWLDLLEEAGAVDLLADPARPVSGGAAAWFTRMVNHVRGWRDQTPDQIMGLIPRLAGRLAADGEPVRLDGGRSGRGGWVSPNMLDLCLELGVPVRAPDEGTNLALGNWVRRPDRALASLRADPVWEPLLAAAVAEYGTVYNQVLEDLLPHAFLRPYVDRRLGELVAPMGGTAVGELRHGVERLRTEVDGRVFHAFPEQRARLEAVDFAEVLATTLRAGIIDEYGWPALDEAARELGGTGARPASVVGTASWPVLTLASATRAIAVGPGGRVAEHALRLPKGAKDPLAVYADGRFLVCYRIGYNSHGYWSDDPGTQLDFPGYDAARSWRWSGATANGLPQLTGDGARMAGGRALRSGESPGKRDLHLLGDGRTYWALDGGTLYEVDPATGDRGRASLPAFLEEQPLAEGEYLITRNSTLAPLPAPTTGTPLGAADGLAGFAVVRTGRDPGSGLAEYRITAADGRTVAAALPGGRGRYRVTPIGLFNGPGAATGVLTEDNGVSLHAADGSGQVWSCHIGQACDCTAKWGTPYLPEPMFWHFMTVRDARASERLRAVRAADLAPLMAAAAAESEDPKEAPRTMVAAAALLSGGPGAAAPDPSLVRGVAGIAIAVANQRRALNELVTKVAKSESRRKRPAVERDPAGLLEGLLHFLADRGGRDAANTGVHLDLTSRFLRGGIGAEELEERPRAGVDWDALIGRIGGIAWYAALPTVPDGVRTELLRFLTRWSGTVFADPGAVLDVGVVVGALKHEPGTGGASRRAALRSRVPATVREKSHGQQATVHHFVELRSGDPLPLAEHEAEHERRRAELAWGTADQLAAFTAAAAEHGPLAWDPDTAAVLAERTGLSRAAAALLLACELRRYRWRAGFLDTGTRKTLGLKTAEADLGARELDEVTHRDLLDLYRAALPESPEEIAALWRPGGTRAVAERLADAWNARYGRRLALDEATEAALLSAGLSDSVGTARLLADASAAPVLTRDTRSRLVVSERNYGGVELRQTPEGPDRLVEVVSGFASLVPWAYADLPGGSAVRQGVPSALCALRDRLDAPDLLLYGTQVWSSDEARRTRLVETVGGAPYRDPDGRAPFPDAVDNGTVVAVPNRNYTNIWFRPARLVDGNVDATVLRGIVADSGNRLSTLSRIDLLRGPGFTGMAERIASGGLAEGAHESDPAAAVPELSAEVAGKLGLSDDAARLYLQLLALLEPTDRRVRAANGWTPARHKKVQAELVGAGLALTAKRSRAGRSVFLPGGWTDAKAPNIPFETWKLPLYDLEIDRLGKPSGPLERFLPLRTLPETFARAWQRVQEGDAPRR
ncbi:hypothetical protein [Actinorugispora endophytica]|uniref:DNA-binding protein n=1 Tax=Actinorugispora endophytica TaxID=1605990 RepID=A0A4R6UVQ6_9ACTN|nr:hypothetical protein [Actinorugispora endophytica]TDQ47594.1 hypothetical protein EV190_12162 [Actinorugispora endophytica]